MMHNIFGLTKLTDENVIIIELQTLLLQGVDLNQKNEQGHTILSIFLLTGRIKVVEFLLSEVPNLDKTYGVKTISNIDDVLKVKGITLSSDIKPEPAPAKVEVIKEVTPVIPEEVIEEEREEIRNDEEQVSVQELMKRMSQLPPAPTKEVLPEPVKEQKKILPKVFPKAPTIPVPTKTEVKTPVKVTEKKLSPEQLRAMADELKKKPLSTPKNPENVVKKSQNIFNEFKIRMEKGKNIWKRINNEDD